MAAFTLLFQLGASAGDKQQHVEGSVSGFQVFGELSKYIVYSCDEDDTKTDQEEDDVHVCETREETGDVDR